MVIEDPFRILVGMNALNNPPVFDVIEMKSD
jgi:hypothetical protein